MKTKIFVTAAAVLVFISSGIAFGATYNFYFNNTEQGNNSTATPNVTISTDGTKSGGTELKPGAVPSPQPSQAAGEPAVVPDASPVTGPYPGPPSASTTVHYDPDDLDSPTSTFKHFMVGPELGVIHQPSLGTSVAPGVGVGWAFTKEFAIHAYVGRYETDAPTSSYTYDEGFGDSSYSYSSNPETHYFVGGDVQFTPFRAGKGDNDYIDFGAIVGANSLNYAGDEASVDLANFPVNVYAGPIIRFNLGRQISIPLSYNFGSNANTLQAGFSIRI